MTVHEFTEARATLGCRHCGTTGHLTTTRNPNNGGLQVVCACGGFDPLGGAPFLAQGRPSTRKPLSRPEEALAATWTRWGDRCAGCGTAAATLDQLGIGRHRQHAPPLAVVDTEADTTLLPLCALCHEHVTANQRALSRLVARLADRLAAP